MASSQSIPIAGNLPNLGLNKNRGMPRRFNVDQVKWFEEEDVYMAREQRRFNRDDLVIPVMGSTGAGKSTFINNVLDALDPQSNKRAIAEDSMKSCTEKVAHYPIDLPPDISQQYNFGSRRLILVDTPGFGHSSLGREEVLRRIAAYLASSYGFGIKVAGVVYVHAIVGERMTESHTSGLEIFQEICGKDAFPVVVVATTRWNLGEQHELTRREDEFRNKLWKGMLDDNATVLRLDNTPNSARGVVNTIFHRVSDPPAKLTVLLLQRQIVDEGKTYTKTSAGLITAKQRTGFSFTNLIVMFRSFFRVPLYCSRY